MQRVYLLTGRPGTGKTRLIQQVIGEYPLRAGGFYTGEIREGERRLGFRLTTLDGKDAVLARTDLPKTYRVGKYGVDLNVIDDIGVPALLEAAAHRDLVVVDEIGRMEMISQRFCEAMLLILAASKWVLGSVMMDAHPFADSIKKRLDVNLVELTHKNYDDVLEAVRTWLEARLAEE